MGRFDIDAGTFDLEIDKEVGPEIVANLDIVLAVENAQYRVIAVGHIESMVADVESHLCVQHIVEEIEVGIDGILAGEKGYTYLILVGAVLEMVLHVVLQPTREFQIEVDTSLQQQCVAVGLMG